MLDNFRKRLARMIAPGKAGGVQVRTYAAARPTRLSLGFNAPQTSADSELTSSLRTLRGRARTLIRDSGYAKRARKLVVDNVIGSGVGIQAQVKSTRGELRKAVNDAIEASWREWIRADSCHTGGALHFNDFERALMGQVFTAGEVFVRIHPQRFGRSKVPLALEMIEAERIADDYAAPASAVQGNEVVLGIEVDKFRRPVAYFIRERHAGEIRNSSSSTDRLERVPAEQIIHLRVIDRWPQTRGEPWLHAAVKKLDDINEYVDSELTAARMSANYFATVETPEGEPSGLDLGSGTSVDNPPTTTIEPGLLQWLAAGEKMNFHTPNRPNPALDPFLRYMLREMATAANVNYASLSGDYSQSNYSSSRLALLDDRETWRALQKWWIRSFRDLLHAIFIERAIYAGAVSGVNVVEYVDAPMKFEAVRFKLRGWSWIDPAKEVTAYKEAVRAGFMSVSQVIELTGNGTDLEEVIELRKAEIAAFEAAGIDVDTTVAEIVEPAPAAPPAPAAAADDDEQTDDAAQDDDEETGEQRAARFRLVGGQ